MLFEDFVKSHKVDVDIFFQYEEGFGNGVGRFTTCVNLCLVQFGTGGHP